MSKTTAFEKKTYEYIKSQGEVQATNIPKMMWGAIPNLENKGLVKTYKKSTTPWSQKKFTFVKAIKEIEV